MLDKIADVDAGEEEMEMIIDEVLNLLHVIFVRTQAFSFQVLAAWNAEKVCI